MNPVVQQPRYSAGGMSNDWQTGMFDCCDDMGICLCGMFFPLCLSCQIASDMNECCLCGASVAMRTMYRTRYGIPDQRPPKSTLFPPSSSWHLMKNISLHTPLPAHHVSQSTTRNKLLDR
ncbi:hypothetical protein MC885_016838 [Smutsia gigantea]|nr:hypothetical protein MC885_016838 [Smutsia gigantea]